ncbi:MAG: hypothetical protein WCT44_03240 [Candidatus Paceibacterota bacterium]
MSKKALGFILISIFFLLFGYAKSAAACYTCYPYYYGYSFGYGTNDPYYVGDSMGTNNYFPANQPILVNTGRLNVTGVEFNTNGGYYGGNTYYSGYNTIGVNEYFLTNQNVSVGTTQYNIGGDMYGVNNYYNADDRYYADDRYFARERHDTSERYSVRRGGTGESERYRVN